MVNRDSDVWCILGGIEWESIVVIIGFVKIGYIECEFKLVSRDIFIGIDWEVGIDWMLIEYI